MKVDIDLGWIMILLTALFMWLKVEDHVAWSWWQVLSPIWVPFAAIGGIIVLLMLIVGIILLLDNRGDY